MISYIKGLDGLRAFAIIFVVIHHSHFLSNSGFLHGASGLMGSGVDLFFVISGYLITNILLASKNQKSFFKNFYIRRFLRLVPLYYLVLLIAFFIVPYINHPALLKLKDTVAWPYWFFLSNYYIAFNGKFQNGLVDLSWSLSVEEQFYVFWSICVYYFQSSTLKKIALAIIFFSPLLRFVLIDHGINLIAIHVMSITRLDTLMFGSLMALVLKNQNFRLRGYLVSILVLSVLLKINMNLPLQYYIAFNYTLLSCIYACVVGAVVSLNSEKNSGIIRFLEWRPVALVGIYSYGIYLFHNPIQKSLRSFFQSSISQGQLPESLIQIIFYISVLIISFTLAGLSFEFYESKWLLFKKRFNFLS